MARFLIRNVLPLVFCLLPMLAGGLIVVALPAVARDFYLQHLTSLDWFIIGLGVLLFLVQTVLGFLALRWETTSFNESFDKSLTSLGQSAEWFPLLGLIGTVAGIMQTFALFGGQGGEVDPHKIIANYAPAITATLSGLLMALINILPTWVITVGRQIILRLGGEPTVVPGGERKPGDPDMKTGAQTMGERL